MDDGGAVLAITGVAALAYVIDVVGLVRLAAVLGRHFGPLKGAVFACVMRASWMAALPGASRALPADEDAEAYVFGGGRVGLLFLPGALVAPEAYAPVLRALAAESGATVVCVKLPFRHPALFSEAALDGIGPFRRRRPRPWPPRRRRARCRAAHVGGRCERRPRSVFRA